MTCPSIRPDAGPRLCKDCCYTSQPSQGQIFICGHAASYQAAYADLVTGHIIPGRQLPCAVARNSDGIGMCGPAAIYWEASRI
jgi:hypothetical protein